MRRLPLVLGALLAALLLAVPSASPARADATIVSATIDNAYPKQLNFKVSARADVDIADVTLAYTIPGRGANALVKPKEFTAGKTVDVVVEVEVNTGASYIPAASEFIYHWEITTSDNKLTKGPDERFLFLPPGKEWKTVNSEIMVVYHTSGRENLATSYLRSGDQTYDKIARNLLNARLQQVPVKVVLFDTERELEVARPGSGGRFDQAVTNCGVKVASDIVLVIPLACGSADRTDTLRHEFGHILNQAAGEGALAKLPSWLDEGTAVYAQSSPGDGYVGAFQAAARVDRLIPFSQMGQPSSDVRLVDLFYGQAYHMVKYLIDKGGPAKYAEYFATIKGGMRFDQALEKVYGFNLGGFEAEFRRSAGIAGQPTVAPTRPAQQVQPTVAPTQRPQQVAPLKAKKDEKISPVVLGSVGVAVLLALGGVFAFLAMQMMAQNRAKVVEAGVPPTPPVEPTVSPPPAPPGSGPPPAPEPPKMDPPSEWRRPGDGEPRE